MENAINQRTDWPFAWRLGREGEFLRALAPERHARVRQDPRLVRLCNDNVIGLRGATAEGGLALSCTLIKAHTENSFVVLRDATPKLKLAS